MKYAVRVKHRLRRRCCESKQYIAVVVENHGTVTVNKANNGLARNAKDEQTP